MGKVSIFFLVHVSRMSTTATFQPSFACLSVTISLTLYIVLCVTLTSQISDANRCPVSDRPACDLCYCSYDRVVVNCSGRQLKYVPSSIPTSAKYIDFNENQIECVPTGYFTFLSNLTILNFERTLIQEAFLLPPSVKTLMAGSNFIRNADLFFTNCDKLSTVYLSCNNITEVPSPGFRNCSQLTYLYLDGNKLSQLPAGMLSGLNVVKLYLFANSLPMLSGSLFEDQLGNSSLMWMQVQNNPLRNISKDFLSSVAEKGELILSCDQLQIPRFQPDITVSCVPPTFVTTLTVFNAGHLLSLQERGFSCRKQSHGLICSSCTVGTYGNKKQLKCVPCPRGGFYQDEVGQYQINSSGNGCKTCNSGTFVLSGGGKNSLSCQVCPEGTNKTKHAGYRACFCLDNYFRRDRFGKCELCPQDGLNCSNDFVTILPGYYWWWNITNFNIYKTYVENLLTFSDSYDSESTSFQAPFPKVYECPQRHKCSNNGSSIQLEATCEKGYRGWMCTECEEGYFPVIGFCQKCPSIWAFVAEMFAFILVAICFLAYVAYTYRRERNATNRSIVDIVLARGKIVLAFYQIMGEFWDSLDVVNWPYVFRQVANWLNIVQFNIAVLVVKPCCFFPRINLSPYQMFVFGVSLPPVVGLLTTFILLLGYSRLWYLKRKNIRIENWNLTLQRLKDRVLTMALMTLYVTYPSTSNAIFTLYPPACETFDLDETKNTEKINLLRSNYSINCDTDIHFKFKTAAYIATLYVLAFPCVLFCLLKKYLKSGATTLTSSRQKNPKWLRFLCENYKDEFWFWEIIELMRRVSQTFVIILFGWGSSLSVTVTLTVAVVFLTLHASYAPMRDKFEHYLQLASLWAIFLNMLVAAVPVADPAIDSPRIEPVMTAILIGLNLIVLLIVIAKPLLWVLKLMKPWKVVSWVIELLPTINWRTESSTFSTSIETSVSQYDDSPTDNEPFLHRPNNYHSLPERF